MYGTRIDKLSARQPKQMDESRWIAIAIYYWWMKVSWIAHVFFFSKSKISKQLDWFAKYIYTDYNACSIHLVWMYTDTLWPTSTSIDRIDFIKLLHTFSVLYLEMVFILNLQFIKVFNTDKSSNGTRNEFYNVCIVTYNERMRDHLTLKYYGRIANSLRSVQSCSQRNKFIQTCAKSKSNKFEMNAKSKSYRVHILCTFIFQIALLLLINWLELSISMRHLVFVVSWTNVFFFLLPL